MTISNARTASPGRVTIVGPAGDARIIETRPPEAQPPVTIRNPDTPPDTTGRVLIAGSATDAVVVEAQPEPTTAVEQAEPEPTRRRRA